jgi:hypothetical protein
LDRRQGNTSPHPRRNYRFCAECVTPAELAKVDSLETDYDVPNIGRVRFTVKRMRAKHHRHSHYVWRAAKPVLIEK